VNRSLLFDQFISNIQEIVDIELMLEFIYMFFLILIQKEETNKKIGESKNKLHSSRNMFF